MIDDMDEYEDDLDQLDLQKEMLPCYFFQLIIFGLTDI